MNRYRLRRVIPVFLSFILSLSALGQSSGYRPGSPLLMWRVSSPAGSAKTNSAYVLGSVHLGDKSLYPLPAVIEDAFQSSNVLIVEVDIRKVDPSQLQSLLSGAAYPAGDDLFRHISPETRTRLTAYFSGHHLPPEIFSKIRPWALGVMIQTMSLVQAGLRPQDGIDMHFLNEAGKRRVEQLEEAEWQIKLLQEMPESLADQWLTSAIAQAESSKEHWAKIAAYWSQGAADKMDELLSSSDMGGGEAGKRYERRLREDRNPHMTERLEKCLVSTDACFMVVGAAHVVGREGIVRQLQARGYRVEQATVEFPQK
jgi:uncharacterized protein